MFAQKISDALYYVGVNDRKNELFERMISLPHGVTYNSYLLVDEKVTLFDSVEICYAGESIDKIRRVLGERKVDYMILHHIEPDHSSGIRQYLAVYPDMQLICTKKAAEMLQGYYGITANIKTVDEGEELSLGSHKLKFIFAPMVHWPEVMMSYEQTEKILFSADGFGCFHTLDGAVVDRQLNIEPYIAEMERYYVNIVGKYGVQAQAGLKKTAGLDIRMICPLHGPVWRSNIDWILQKYQKWTTWTPEEEGYTIVYGSMYGHTASAAEAAAAYIQKKSGKPVRVYDVSETHTSYLISEIWRFSRVLLFCPTYNGGIYPEMEALVRDIIALGVQNRIFGLAENGSWAPQAGKKIQKELEDLKNCKVAEDILSFKGALHEADEERMQAWADAVMSATLS